MTFKSYLRGVIWGFKRDERGSTGVETVIILPIMFWTFLALFAAFHGYRTYAINQKAAYTIGDMVSRETNAIDSSYMQGAKKLFMFLTAGDDGDTALRITAVKYDLATNSYEREWSQSKGYVNAADDATVASWNERLPTMPDNEVVMVVETFHQYNPVFNTGLTNREVRNFVFTRPRYAPQVLYSDGTS